MKVRSALKEYICQSGIGGDATSGTARNDSETILSARPPRRRSQSCTLMVVGAWRSWSWTALSKGAQKSCGWRLVTPLVPTILPSTRMTAYIRTPFAAICRDCSPLGSCAASVGVDASV